MRLHKHLKNSVSSRLFRSWVILGASALGASLIGLLAMIWLEHSNQRSRAIDNLRAKSTIIARRMAGELIVGERGTIQPVIEALKQELNVDKIVLLPPGVDCQAGAANPECTSSAEDFWVTSQIPNQPHPRFVLVARDRSLISEAIPYTTLLVATLTVVGLLLGGIILQWSAIQRHLLKPINSLLESGRKKDDSETWPIELQKIEEKLRKLLDERDRATHEAHRLKTEAMVADLSQRILNDLKSPLGTLGMMIETDLKEVPAETKDSMRRVLGRIRAIVDSNLKEYSLQHTVYQVEVPAKVVLPLETPSSMVGGALKAILDEEKSKAAAQGVEFIETISKQTYTTFSPLSFSELCRVFSNLLANAVEAAAHGKKKVLIDASMNGECIEVKFRDYGTGFSPEVLKKLLAGNPTTTKTKGNGLGFLNAKSLIEAAGGKLTVQSFPNGALITLMIPTVATPIWFEDVTRTRAHSVLALDDDSTIAQKLMLNLPGLRIDLVQSEGEFLARTQDAQHDLYLIDYDFGGHRNGLDLIIQENLQQKAVLVSGKIVFDQKLRSSAAAQGVKMFPKESLA